MDSGYAAVHAGEDRAHWWFLGRQTVILAEMARRLPAGGLRLAELGCGSGGLLPGLARFGDVVGIEADPALLRAADARGLPVLAGALPDRIPLEAGTLDAACLFDVLEHLDDDGLALERVRALLVPGGSLFVTVPAYPWLWSRHDEILGHRRRYTGRGLRVAVEGAGFKVERLTYFNSLLAAPIVLARLLHRLTGRQTHDLSRPPAPVNRLLAGCFAFEARLLRWVSSPFGISLLLVARRPR
ncbi:MAG: class I SAM-dependent methyltransferase [Candidatus Rokubacteria bacterium]|nr:class I SAM-dependent methyltransferase [Candidatus Rokubacteria bacterium]